MQTDPDLVLSQIRRLEKRVAALRRRQAAGILGLVGLVGLGMSPANRPGGDILVAKSFIVVDEAGDRVAQLGSYDGRPMLTLGGFKGGMPIKDGPVTQVSLGVDGGGVMFVATHGTDTGARALMFGVRDEDVSLMLQRGETAHVGALLDAKTSAIVVVAPDGGVETLAPSR